MVALVVGLCEGVDNGVGRTPAMGYNTWNDFRCDISETDIKDAADAIIRQGLDKVGYVYVNMDDCWAKGRYPNGTVYPDPTTFPNGIKHVADYVHSKGLKFGIYSDRGTLTCAGRPGSENYEKIDAQTYASWGVDYLKEDSCYASGDHQTAFTQYGLMRDALNSTGRPIYFSLCGWNSWYSPVGWSLGNSWRIAGDCNTWPDVLNAIDTNVDLTKNAYPGGWNDPDMLIGSSEGSAVKLTPDQSRAMFSIWSVMAAPLLIGGNIRNLNAWDLQTYSNVEVIAVDQDTAGHQGIRVAGSNLIQGNNTSPFNIWAKLLQDGSHAVVFLNNANSVQDVTCDSTCFANIGLAPTMKFRARDLWQHKDLGVFIASSFTAKSLPPSGGHALYRFIHQ
uniref:Alpha-galactosidase n=1 Tax=Arcella intermedia TaxID=1963864 RepID=A0A6B2L6K9_9EUKA